MEYYLGPMSKNIVDTVIEYCAQTGQNITFIPPPRS